MGDVVRAMPWSNTVDVVVIPGDALMDALEHSVAAYDITSDDPSGKFLQVNYIFFTGNCKIRSVAKQIEILRNN